MVGSLSGFPSYRLSSPRLEVSSEIEVEDEEEEEDDEDDEEDNGDVGDIRTTHSAMGTSRITVEKKIERRRKKARPVVDGQGETSGAHDAARFSSSPPPIPAHKEETNVFVSDDWNEDTAREGMENARRSP